MQALQLSNRIRIVLEILVLAGEVARAAGPTGGLCWGRPLRYVNLGGGRAVAIGTAALTSDVVLIGEGIVRSVGARPNAPGLSVCLGAPSFRAAMARLDLSSWGTDSLLEFQAAAFAAAARRRIRSVRPNP